MSIRHSYIYACLYSVYRGYAFTSQLISNGCCPPCLRGKNAIVTIAICTMEQVSEYFSLLSTEAKLRYEQKVAKVGLKTDPYVMPSDLWVEESPSVPNIAWSDMFLYMISTLSPYTTEKK